MRSTYLVYASATSRRIAATSAAVARRNDAPPMRVSIGWGRALNTEVLAHRHGRRARPRRTRASRRRRVPAAPGRAGAAVSGADQQLDLHAARPVGPAEALRAHGARGIDLDLRPGHRGLPRFSTTGRVGLCDR